ncbi:MAG: hypothetical protein IPI66_03975 [Chitinophagaceae bacterium]|nr:hypothetical protein [Chitinophagaceae bacterium]MBL0055515.1 hypothetical protein [Chitinophagaceae bacterium]
MNFQTLNKQRKFVLIAALLGIIACFLPWVSVSVFGYSSSVNGMHSWGLMAFIGFIGSGVAAFLGDQTKPMAQTFWFVALACGALAVLGVLLYFLNVSGSVGGFGVSYGFGIFIAAAAAIGVLACAYMFRNPGDSIKGGFDSLKQDIEDKAKT